MSEYIELRQSALKAWLRCNRKFVLRYIEGWVEKKDITYKDVRGKGTYVHGHLAEYYDPLHTSEDLMHEFNPDDVRMGDAMINTYGPEVEAEGLDIGQETLSVEQRIYSRPYVMPSGRIYTVSCQIDQVVRCNIRGIIGRDHKTSAQFFSTAPNDFQLLTYGLVMHQNGTTPDHMEHNIVKANMRTTRSSGPYVQRNLISVSPESLEFHDQMVEAILYDIDRHYGMTVDNPSIFAVAQNDCSWQCSYSDICDMVEHGDDIDAALTAGYEKEEAPQ